jgi:selenocysteine lyase/cysteine desulfurase
MSYKSSFDIPDGITYLNGANMSPQLKHVTDQGIVAVNQKKHPWKILAADWFTGSEQLRTLAAQIFRTSADNIALVPSVSYGLAVAAKNINIDPGKSILLLDKEFPSNYYIWQQLAKEKNVRIRIVTRETGQNWTEAILSAMDANTGLVTLGQCHWMDGSLIRLDEISKKTHEMGIPLILDLSQSLGARPIDIDSIAPDFAVSVGYKWLLGPYGLGYMYVSPDWHEKGAPLEYSWLTRKDSEDFTQLVNYTESFRPGARKFDMGEFSQFNLVPMAQAALGQILEWGVDSIHNYIAGLTRSIPDLSRGIPSIHCEEIDYAGHIRGITVTSDPALLAIKKALSEKNIYVSFRSNVIRIAPHIYNDQQDINRLFECIAASITK